MAKFFSVLILFASVTSTAAKDEIPFYTQKDFSPVWKNVNTQKLIEMPDFNLVDHNAQKISRHELEGQVSVINFFYASCTGICPTAMSQLGRMKEKLKSIDKIRLFSFSITPSVDTPGVMKAFAEKRNLSLQNWFLLSGKESEIKKVAAVFQANKDVPSRRNGEFVHSENVFLLDQKGRLRGIYNIGSEADMDLLAKDSYKLHRP